VKHYVLHWDRETDLDNAGPFKVLAGHYFMMGDNQTTQSTAASRQRVMASATYRSRI
jgi:hypothetical protein